MPKISVRHRSVPVCVLVVALSMTLGGELARAAQPTPKANPDPLLKQFPIGTDRVTTTPRAPKPRASKAPAPAVRRSAPESHAALWATLAAGVGGLGLLAVLAAWRIRSRRRAESDEPTPYISETALRHLALALEKQEWDGSSPGVGPPGSRPERRRRQVTEVSQDRTHDVAGSSPVGLEQPQAERAEAPSDGVSPSREPDYGGVGERIASILEAAETAAAQIRREAVEAAADIREKAKAAASAHLRRAEEDATRVTTEADAAAQETRSAAESYGTRQRREAEAEAGKMLAEAETQARATRQAAEEMARQIEAAAREREQALRAQLRPLEATLQRALDAFRGMSAQLEDVLYAEEKDGGESLAEALDVSARRPAPADQKSVT